jgi:TPR repeat protein
MRRTRVWCRKAAEFGDAMAQHNIGVMYDEGQGMTQDDVKAFMLFKLAAAQGFDPSTKAHNIVAAQMTPADISKAERFARECVEKNYKGCGF